MKSNGKILKLLGASILLSLALGIYGRAVQAGYELADWALAWLISLTT